MHSLQGIAYEIAEAQLDQARMLADRVQAMRTTGALTPEVLGKLRKYVKIKNIYNSNAIEGSTLDVGETRLVVEQGLTISGKPLKDQAEAKNLSAALDFLEELAKNIETPITEADIRQLHYLVLTDNNRVNAGRYRLVPVEIGGSAFKPPNPEHISGEMNKFGEWLKSASSPGSMFKQDEVILVASAAHTWFVTIHPFVDGNGRVARLLMNLLFMRYRFPIAVITREDRTRYYDALELSQVSDLTGVVSLVSESIEESLEEYEAAASEQRDAQEWAKSVALKFGAKEKITASNHYEVWKNAMELLKSLIRQTADLLDANANVGKIYFTDFGNLGFEKYLSLKKYGSAKKTWFFRIDFKIGTRSARYLFFFASPSHEMRDLGVDVTLHLSREEPAGSFHYEFLDQITAPNVPNIVEIGYNPESEAFVVRGVDSRVREEKVDSLCRFFIQEVVEKTSEANNAMHLSRPHKAIFFGEQPLRPGDGQRQVERKTVVGIFGVMVMILCVEIPQKSCSLQFLRLQSRAKRTFPSSCRMR
ncbi:MAG: Fic family protein [Cyanobacteriota bacterium]